MTETKTGRPTLLTAELEAVCLAALHATPVKKYAAERAGISERTWHTWEAKGETQLHELATATNTDDPADITLDTVDFNTHPYAHFLLSLRKARTDYLLHSLAKIKQAGDGYESKVEKRTIRPNGEVVVETTTRTERAWQAEAWLIERQFPEYRLAHKVEVSGPDDGPVQVDVLAERILERHAALATPDDPGDTDDDDT